MSNTKSKHTPGPWKVTGFIQNSKYETFGFAIDHESDEHDGFETVAVTYTANEDAYQNAHLIAAAPELYAFAERMTEYFQDNPNGYDDMRAEVKAALAKARGEQR